MMLGKLFSSHDFAPLTEKTSSKMYLQKHFHALLVLKQTLN